MAVDDFVAIANRFPSPTLLVDKGDIVLAANRAVTQLGIIPDHVVGKHVWEFVQQPALAVQEFLQRARGSGKPTTESLELNRPDGSTVTCLCEAAVAEHNVAPDQATLLLRLEPRDSLANVASLHEKIHELASEIQWRTDAAGALRESQDRLRLALQAGRMGIWDWEVRTNKVNWSPGMEMLHGIAPGRFPGTLAAFLEDVHPDDRQRVQQSIDEAVRHGIEHQVEYRIVWPDGSLHWVEGRGSLVRDESGQPVRVVGICLDISERKHLEGELCERLDDLVEAEARIRSVVDHVVDGIITIDEQGLIHSMNPAAEKLFDYSAADVIGFNIKLLMPEPFRSEHDRYLHRYLHTGEAKIIGIGREVLGQRSDGTVFPMDLGVSEFRIGDRRYFTGIVRDVTERQQNERNTRFLAEASAALATLVDYQSTLQKVAGLSVPFFADWCAVDLVNDLGTLERVAIAHIDPSKATLGQEVSRRYPRAPDTAFGPAQVVRTGKSELVREIPDSMLETMARDPDHRRLLQQVGMRSYICVPLTTRGRTLGAVTFVVAESGRRYDLNDLALAEDLARRAAVAVENARLYRELRDAHRRKDEFLAMLAHELRNPLAPIRNALTLLKYENVDVATAQGAHDIMERQLEHLVRLVDDLLDVSRIMRGKIELRREPVELKTVVQRAIETVQPLIDTQEHELIVSIPEDPIWLLADGVRIAQVLGNLLNNAAKYTEKHGKICLIATREPGGVQLTVRDNGIGIDPEVLPKIFDLFTQADRSIERSQGGLGIGLTLVRALIEMHDGTVGARSDGVGNGSEFTVQLPCVVDNPHRASDQWHPTSTRSLRILVVDDLVGAAETLAALLRKFWSHEVRVAHDGLAALDLAKSFLPEMVLLDIGLPGISGYAVAQRLREQSEFKNSVLVALTGYGQSEDRQRSRDAGFDEHLVKPASVADLERLFQHPKLNKSGVASNRTVATATDCDR